MLPLLHVLGGSAASECLEGATLVVAPPPDTAAMGVHIVYRHILRCDLNTPGAHTCFGTLVLCMLLYVYGTERCKGAGRKE